MVTGNYAREKVTCRKSTTKTDSGILSGIQVECLLFSILMMQFCLPVSRSYPAVFPAGEADVVA